MLSQRARARRISITQLSRLLGVTTKALRHYERQGLLRVRRPSKGVTLIRRAAVRRLVEAMPHLAARAYAIRWGEAKQRRGKDQR